MEYDSRVAVNITVDEAAAMMQDWVQENKDHEFAKKLTKSYEEELRLQKKIELEHGEKEALRLAIEETRRARAAAQQRQERAKQDERLARQLIEADEKEQNKLRSACSEDEKIARQLSGDCAEAKGTVSRTASFSSYCKSGKDMRNRNVVRDNKEDDDTDEDDEEEDCKYMEEKEEEISRANNAGRVAILSPMTKAPSSKSSAETKRRLQAADSKQLQEELDAQAARKVQNQLDAEQKMSSLEQQKADAKLSFRLSVKAQREEHRLEKFRAMQRSFEKCRRDEASVALLWENAIAEVEDVEQAICITILLPNIAMLNVTAPKGANKVVIEAKRLVGEAPVTTSGGKGFEYKGDLTTVDNTQYVAEFRIRGMNAQLGFKDVHTDYSSESGLLHVYVEGINLQDNNSNNRSFQQLPADDVDDDDDDDDDLRAGCGGGKGRGGEQEQAFMKHVAGNASVQKMVAKAMQDGFKRVFGRK